ncbi:unnamed protein product [Urochloa humidicola]
MHNTLRPTIAVFITNELLEHPDPNVKVVVTFYLTEVTRITAPEAPYDDDVIKWPQGSEIKMVRCFIDMMLKIAGIHTSILTEAA